MRTLIWLLLFTSFYSHSQKMIEVRGTVLDPSGMPIKRAVLFVDSVKTFVKTNNKGIYKTSAREGTKSLAIFSDKHGLLSKQYNGESQVDFIFEGSVDHLTETDLQAMGFSLEAPRKGRMDPSNFKDYENIYVLIQAMFSGIEVNGSNIVVRGANSFGDNTPLFVVDSNYVSSIDFVNPVDVRSIELLKGGDAAFYGARGANGVFVIELVK